MSAHFQPEERSNFRNNGSDPGCHVRDDVAANVVRSIHLYGTPDFSELRSLPLFWCTRPGSASFNWRPELALIVEREIAMYTVPGPINVFTAILGAAIFFGHS